MGRRTPKSSDSCGCRINSAVATGPPYGESLCFTGRKGGRRINSIQLNSVLLSISGNLFCFRFAGKCSRHPIRGVLLISVLE